MGQNLFGIIIQSVLVGFFLGIVLWFIFEGPIVALITDKKKKMERKINKAIEDGHLVKAHLVKCYDDPDNYGKKQQSYIAVYEYNVNGKHYRRTYDFYRKPSADSLDLVWLKNPSKAHTIDVLLTRNFNNIERYIFVGILVMLLFSILFKK